MSQILISIIVPIYKVEPYLRRCLDSIVNQSYTNLEIILVDDGSPDDCPQICDEYAAKDKRIVVVHKDNGGLSDARNAGLDICTGEYVYFIDSDDFIKENTIDFLTRLALSENADIVAANYLPYDNFSETTECIAEDSFKEISFDDAMRMQTYAHPKFTQIVVAWNKLIRRHIAKAHRFPLGKLCEDNYTTYKYFFDSRKTIISDIQLYYYQLRDDSIVSQLYQTIKNEIITIEYTQEKIRFLRQKGRQKLASYFFKRLANYELPHYYSLNTPLEKKQLIKALRHFSDIHHPLLTFAIHHPELWGLLKKLLWK